MQSAKTFSPNLSITLAAASLTGLVRSAFRLFAFYSAKFRFDQEEVLGVLFKATQDIPNSRYPIGSRVA